MTYSEALEQQARVMATPAAWAPHGRTVDGVVSDQVRRAVRDGETTYVAASICRLLEHAAGVLPTGSALVRASLPFPGGFVWFEYPLVIPERSDSIAAFAWHDAAWTSLQGELTHGVFIAFWREQCADGLCLAAVLWWDYAAGWDSWTPEAPGLQTDDAALSAVTMAQRAYVLSLFSFMQQRLLVAPAWPAERHVRRRLERAGWEHVPLIRVVQLRRTEASQREGIEPVEREWTCQWIVRGHWRQQWHPKAQAHQPIWIMPHVKGPDGKPLKPPRATVFAVVR